MRVSSDSEDPGYAQWQAGLACGMTYDVELDGVLITADCVMADEEKGEVVRNMRDMSGNLVIDRGVQRVCEACGQFVPNQTRVLRETLHGTVRVIERRRAMPEKT